MHVHSALDISEHGDIRVFGIIPIAELVHIVDQVHDNGFWIVGRMEAQDRLCFFRADLVITEILNVLDDEMNGRAQALFDGAFDQITDFADGVVAQRLR